MGFACGVVPGVRCVPCAWAMRCSYPPLVFLGWVSRASRVGGPLGVCLVVFVCSPGVSLSPLGVVLVVPVVPWVVPVVAGSLTPWWGCPVLFVQPGSAWGVFVAPAGFGLWGFVSLFCVWPVRPRSVCSVLTLRGCSPPWGVMSAAAPPGRLFFGTGLATRPTQAWSRAPPTRPDPNIRDSGGNNTNPPRTRKTKAPGQPPPPRRHNKPHTAHPIRP